MAARTDRVRRMTVQDLRESRGWSRTKLAAELGVSERAVYRWESGTIPYTDMRRDIALLFDTTPNDIDWHGPQQASA